MRTAAADNVNPEGKWTFDGDVTLAFDDMLRRSIPQYDVMRRACFDLASAFVQEDSDIVDLGCSRGEVLAQLVDKFGAHNHFVGVDVSDPMLEVARDRFAHYIQANVVSIQKLDLRTDYPPVRASVTLAVLTLQFVPIEHRQTVLRKVFEHTLPKGALVIVEKVLGDGAALDAMFVRNYYELKRKNGYSLEAIDRKRLSLEGVLVPITARWNEEALRVAGFARVECFWRWMNFAGWIAVKE
jgi:tRNA (cmo5U34)-methyltransferase